MIANNALLLLLLVLAVTGGWTLARSGLRMDDVGRAQLPSQYYRGFNFLLDGEEEDAIDAFTEALSVNEETLDTHIALGSVLRKRGEVDRAIRIHQNLLARSHLTAVQLHQVHLELARDFIAAGLYDRAEQLLRDLSDESPDLNATAQRHLLEVFEAQREWSEAVVTAENLVALSQSEDPLAAGHGQSAHQLRCHYLCEQAEAAITAQDSSLARQYYQDALRDNDNDLRARMGLATVSLLQESPQEALEHFEVIMASGRTCTPELLSLLSRICAGQAGERAYSAVLRRYYQQQPAPLLALTLAAELEAEKDRAAADDFLRLTLADNPSVAVATALLLSGLPAENDQPERRILEQLMQNEQGYACDHCGFTGRSRHWRCPGCRHWDSIHYLGTVPKDAHV
jgi:lipopolysaccharide biosynthesis regulator YciM